MSSLAKYSLAACSHYVFTAFPYENLGVRGFTLDSSLDTEQDGLVIQTLMVPSSENGPVALEFREIIDEEEFLASHKRLQTAARGRDLLQPCLRFYGEETGKFIVGSIPVEVVSKAGHPGAMAANSNSVQKLVGVYLGLTEAGIREWTEFLGAPYVDGGWNLKGGARIMAAQPNDGLYEFMQHRKDFPVWAVILNCESLETFRREAEPDKLLQWQGKTAAVIKEHLTDWDLLVVEN
jgi:hypothetical protein